MKIVIEVWGWYKKYIKELCTVFIISVLIMISSIAIPLLTRFLVDDGLYSGNFKISIIMILCLVSVELLVSYLSYTQEKISTKIKSDIEYSMNTEVFLHSLKIKYKYYKDYSLLKVINDVFYDVDEILNISEDGFVTLFITVFKMIGGSIALLYINWRLSVLIMLIIPIKIFLNCKFKKTTYGYSVKLKKNNENYNFWLEDATKCDVDIRLWNLKDVMLSEYKKICKDNIFTIRKRRLLYKEYNCIVDCVEKLGIYLIYILGAYSVIKGDMTVGEIISFIGFSIYLLSPVDIFLHFAMIINDIQPSMESYKEFMNYEVESIAGGNVVSIDRIDRIEFKDVDFQIKKDIILKKVNFIINKGEKVAFIGENGSGKTSCINLITSLYEASSGNIFVNGIEIGSINIESLRDSISIVCQHVYLFNKTILENIALGSGLSPDEQCPFFKKNNLFKFVNKLPYGWNTQVGVSGSKLSGGERQKIALGRVMHKDSSVIILDEPTSAYDEESAEYFNKWISQDFQEKILIISTHDREILNYVDKVFEFKNGEIEVYSTSKGVD